MGPETSTVVCTELHARSIRHTDERPDPALARPIHPAGLPTQRTPTTQEQHLDRLYSEAHTSPTHPQGRGSTAVPSSSGTIAVHDRSRSLIPFFPPPLCNIKKTHLHDVRQGRVTRLVEPEVRGYHRREPQGHHLRPRVGLSLHLQLPAPVRHRDLPWPPARPAEPLPPTEIESKTRLLLCAPR